MLASDTELPVKVKMNADALATASTEESSKSPPFEVVVGCSTAATKSPAEDDTLNANGLASYPP